MTVWSWQGPRMQGACLTWGSHTRCRLVALWHHSWEPWERRGKTQVGPKSQMAAGMSRLPLCSLYY